LDDLTLLRRFTAHRDNAALDALVERHWDFVYRFALRLTHNTADADDVVQQTFLQMMRLAEKFNGQASARAWLGGLALHVHKNRRRAETRLQRREQEKRTAAAAVAVAAKDASNDGLRTAVRESVDELPNHFRLPLRRRRRRCCCCSDKRLRPF
jgi:RNA polymerase sigma-70 factor (ECF subfamily)